MSERYIVLPRDDYNIWKWSEDLHSPEPIEITDAIVIRKSDIFASSVLYEYANMLRTAVEVADDLLGMPAEDRPEKARRLMELADEVYDHAADAEEKYKGELPV